MEQGDLLSNELLISETSQSNLNTAAKWGKFLAIVGFILIAIMLIAGIWAQIFLSYSRSSLYDSEFIKYIGIVYAVVAIILFFPCLYLFKFSNKMQDAIRVPNQESLDTAFINLKSMFKFYGIFTIVILVMYAIAFIVGIGGTMR